MMRKHLAAAQQPATKVLEGEDLISRLQVAVFQWTCFEHAMITWGYSVVDKRCPNTKMMRLES